MKFTFLYILSFFVLVLAFNACTHDDFSTETTIPDGMKVIELNLKVQNQTGSGMSRSTSTGATLRALGEEPGNKYNTNLNENKIENVEVFLFNSDGTLKKHATSTTGLQKTGDDTSSTLRILIPVIEVSGYENKSFKVVVVANTARAIGTIATLDELKAKIQETEDINKPDTPQTKFLMDGEIDSQSIIWGENVVYRVPDELPLRRAASKIRLRIREVNVKETANNQTVSYIMEGQPQVKLVHYTEKTSLMQGKPYSIASADWKNAAYRPMNPYVFTGLVNETTPETPNTFLAASVPFYAYENDWSANNNADETYLMVKIDFKAQTGTDAGGQPIYGPVKPYYYRIPVNYRMEVPGMTAEEIAGLHKLQRNHLYDIVSSINVLGSEDEGVPFLVEAFVAVQPWNEPDVVDGSIANAHYLVVKELHPLMPNIDTREVEYLSDLPITIKIDKTVYEYYDGLGRKITVEETPYDETYNIRKYYMDGVEYDSEYVQDPYKFDGTTVTYNETDPLNKKLIINHQIPINYVPFDIYFTVTHVMPQGETGTPLSQAVRVTQYPPKYVTGTKSTGYRPNPGETVYADFRFHDALGAIAYNPVTGHNGPQQNDVFFRITTVVNATGESIGDPTNPDGSTKRDAASNKLISPEFIIATQHGMSLPVYQYEGGDIYDSNDQKGAGFGPYSSYFPDRSPYYDPNESYYDNKDRSQLSYKSYTSAADRCANYFEGEYGTNGNYTEHYVDYYYQAADGYYYPHWSTRTVTKTFKYQGRWRIPTFAEIQYINNIQDAPGSAVKHLLWGAYYWSAETNRAYNFNTNSEQNTTEDTQHYVRCIFDTYKVND